MLAFIVGTVAGLLAGVAVAGNEVTSESLLRELGDPIAVTRYPDPPFRLLQASSYDRASGDGTANHKDNAEAWFANGDAGHFLRVEIREGRTESVMLDAQGPGAVVRIWSPNPKGTMRIYVDGAATPIIAAPMAQLLDGTTLFGAKNANQPLAAELSKGWNLFVPIPFTKRCVITTDDGAGVYYQINWRDYADNVPVAPYDAAAAGRFAGFAPPERELYTRARPRSVEIAAGATESMATFDQPGVIRSMLINAEPVEHLVLAASFDGEETVWIPLAELSRHARDWRGEVPPQGERASPPSNFYVDWPMPFAKSAELRVINLGAAPARVSILPIVQPYAWDSRSMHFHATWKRDWPIHTRPMRDYRYVSITGKGVLAGDSLHIVNPVDVWWGEGDEKISVDGEFFPSHFGTGTEDYYGYGWCFPVPFSHPLHSQSVCDGEAEGNNFGRTIVTRLRGLDTIPFDRQLDFDMELWHWAECDVSYAPATFFYAMPGATTDVAPAIEEAKRGWPPAPQRPKPFQIEGAMECESMAIVAMTPGLATERQGLKAFGSDTWSGDAHRWVKPKELGAVIELAVPVDAAAANDPVRVILYATRSWDYGIVQFSVNGMECGGPFDLLSSQAGKVETTGPIDLGVHLPHRGRLVLRAELVGSNERSAAPGTFFGLDCVRLERAD
jgi:hypothetical protein